ncbi:putative alcohol dehydrogenase [Helianthus annuus]|nr:putative alcohol dehydrogenase [Helianthus annuus]
MHLHLICHTIRYAFSAAAIARIPGEPLVIEEVLVAAPKPREVRIKIICTSVCPVDVTFWRSEVQS